MKRFYLHSDTFYLNLIMFSLGGIPVCICRRAGTWRALSASAKSCPKGLDGPAQVKLMLLLFHENLKSIPHFSLILYVEYYLFLLQLKAVFLNLVYFADEHFQANRLLIKYW